MEVGLLVEWDARQALSDVGLDGSDATRELCSLLDAFDQVRKTASSPWLRCWSCVWC